MRTFFVCTILVFCFLAFGCKGLVFNAPTENMLPTIKVDEKFFVNQYSSVEATRFDIVMFKAPVDITKTTKENEIRIVSRIIGLPNERLEIKDNKIFINFVLLDEPFEKIVSDEDIKKSFGPIVIPDGQYFMIGDNRPNSFDSRYWKNPTISKADILGKVIKFLPN
jgi:signal peptidase I